MEQIIIDFPTEYKVKCKLLDLKKELVFIEICEGLQSFVDEKKYPGSIFMMKNNTYYFEIEKRKKIIWCRLSKVWNVFSDCFDLSYEEIQGFIRGQVEEHFKLKGFTPSLAITFSWREVEEHFKLKGFTPSTHRPLYCRLVEEHFKLKGFTPVEVIPSSCLRIEEHFKLKGFTPLTFGTLSATVVEEHFKK